MKKAVLSFLVLAFLLSLGVHAAADDADAWKAAPVIKSVYEADKEKLIVEWEGSADLYQVYLDGKMVSTVNLNNAIIEVKTGRHQIQVIPIKLESKGINTSVEFGLLEIVSGSIDLAALGVDPKDILQGSRSPTITLTYSVDPLFSAVPEITEADTDHQDRVILSFKDKYNSDLYKIGIKSGKDVNYIEFDPASAGAAGLVTKNNASVTVILDQEYLKKSGCMVPELDEEYSFSVTLEKYALDMVTQNVETSAVHSSKESKFIKYAPVAAWKAAPEIVYASQTADGQITLRWEHGAGKLPCEYEVKEITKTLGVKRKETLLSRSDKKEIVIKDLMNGTYYYTVTPVYSGEAGDTSEEVSIKLKNDWVAAPVLQCEALSGNRIKLMWQAAAGVESYHITVYAGSGSLLRYVNLDFKEYTEFDVEAKPGSMEYIFNYGQDIVSDNGVKLKFEIYGIRHAANGTEQQSSSSKQIIAVK